jgi:hypothetical protein
MRDRVGLTSVSSRGPQDRRALPGFYDQQIENLRRALNTGFVRPQPTASSLSKRKLMTTLFARAVAARGAARLANTFLPSPHLLSNAITDPPATNLPAPLQGLASSRAT